MFPPGLQKHNQDTAHAKSMRHRTKVSHHLLITPLGRISKCIGMLLAMQPQQILFALLLQVSHELLLESKCGLSQLPRTDLPTRC